VLHICCEHPGYVVRERVSIDKVAHKMADIFSSCHSRTGVGHYRGNYVEAASTSAPAVPAGPWWSKCASPVVTSRGFAFDGVITHITGTVLILFV
jgi:hypothetical protein